MKINYIKLLKMIGILALSFLTEFTIRFILFKGQFKGLSLYINVLIKAIFDITTIAILYKLFYVKKEPTIKINLIKITYISVIVFVVSSTIFIFKKTTFQHFNNLYFLIFCLKTVLIAPILEEIIYRKLLLGEVLEESKNKIYPVLAVSFVFSITHIGYLNKPLSLIMTFIFSILVSYLYLKTKSTLLVIIIHAINNFIAFFKPFSVLNYFLSLNFKGISYSVIQIGLFVGITSLCGYAYYKFISNIKDN